MWFLLNWGFRYGTLRGSSGKTIPSLLNTPNRAVPGRQGTGVEADMGMLHHHDIKRKIPVQSKSLC